MKSEENTITKSQEVITLVRNVPTKGDETQPIYYPELEMLFQKGFYVESFRQTMLGTDRYMVTFNLRTFNPSTY